MSREDLCSSEFRQQAHQLWIKNGGLIGLRGIDLNKLTSNELMDWSANFGDVDHDNFVAREDKKLTVYQYYVSETHGMNREKAIRTFPKFLRCVMTTTCVIIQKPEGQSGIRLNVSSRTTDRFGVSLPESATVWGRNTIRGHPIIFKLDPEHRKKLEELEAVCSLAHHDKKISLYSLGIRR